MAHSCAAFCPLPGQRAPLSVCPSGSGAGTVKNGSSLLDGGPSFIVDSSASAQLGPGGECDPTLTSVPVFHRLPLEMGTVLAQSR